jgi:DeoR family transcriptional regulator, glycerol-3-phosphate regulon repressor
VRANENTTRRNPYVEAMTVRTASKRAAARGFTPNPRQSELLAAVREHGVMTVEAMSDRFGVTLQTVRRDVGLLADAGLLARYHGGARIPSSTTENIGYGQRQHLNEQAKRKIARAVAKAVPAGSSLIINIGTTTEAVARALLKHRNLMVITNNLNVANILATSPNSEVIVAGGILRRADGALVGDVTAEFIGQFKVDYAIIGSAAVDPDGSLLDYDFREVRVAQAIIKNARKSYLVADHTKFKMAAPVRIASLADLDGFFTDIPPPKTVVQLCADNDVFIRTVEAARGR